jgi:hypothetical protein
MGRLSFFLKREPGAKIEQLGQEDVEHVAFPGAKGAVLVVSHPQEGLPFLKTLLDGPPERRDPGEVLGSGVLRSVGEGVLHLPLRSFEKEEPLAGDGLPFFGRGPVDPEAGEMGPQGALAPLFQEDPGKS